MGATLKAKLRKALGAVDAVEEGEGIFHVDEPAFFVNGKLVAEFAGPNSIGVRLTRASIRERKAVLAADPRVDRIKPSSDWVAFHFRRAADVEAVVELVAAAAPHYLPAPGTPLRPPPTGADLERRRRFH